MRLVLIADTFPPLRTSGAVQLRDLSREFARQGHDLTVILPGSHLSRAWALEEVEGYKVLRLSAFKTKDIGYFQRVFGEVLMPFAMRWNLRRSPVACSDWDGVIWYSPSIFHGPLVSAVKRAAQCRSYLIIRDIFPDWAVDMGLMGRGIIYRFFDTIARYQYSVADVIGVQSSGNLAYFAKWARKGARQLEVLPNWLGEARRKECPIDLSMTPLACRTVFVYTGNMGVAQGMDQMLELAAALESRSDIGFLFVGRGSDARRLATAASKRQLSNVLFHDEIDPDEIPALYEQCDIGLVSLDERHKSHNIPGKFLAYMQNGLPVLACCNKGNDLVELIRRSNVGTAVEGNSSSHLQGAAAALVESVQGDRSGYTERCHELFNSLFTVRTTVQQIVTALSGERVKALGTDVRRHAASNSA